MAILKTYNNEGVRVGLVGDDRPARRFCHKCGTIVGSSFILIPAKPGKRKK